MKVKKTKPTSNSPAPGRKAQTVSNSKSQSKRAAANVESKIPPVLLEGDFSAPPAGPSGPGKRYDLGSETPLRGRMDAEEAAGLPEAYGTERLLLTARDPHWLYAHWDLTQAQQRHYNGLSVNKHLILRIFKDEIQGEPFSEIHVHPESRNWFVHVGQAGSKFVAALGYYRAPKKWVTVSKSEATVTPPDSMSEDTSFWFETLPADLRFEDLVRLVRTVVKESVPLVEAIQQLRSSGYAGLPTRRAISSGQWTPEQERALAQVVSMDTVRRVWMGSLEITELIRRHLQKEISSAGLAQFSIPSSWSGAISSISSLSSPFGAKAWGRSFWFNVNAELIIYGATEPDAKVSIAGRNIKLRPDGTFSFRFALPDGDYDLPAVAQSADGMEQRSAALTFRRHTQYQGVVGQHPQDPKLKPPRAESVS
jgi:uncharacterized protein